MAATLPKPTKIDTLLPDFGSRLERIARAMSNNPHIRLLFSADQCYTDGSRIVLPGNCDKLAQEDMDLLWAYVNHEAEHVLVQDETIEWKKAYKKCPVNPKLLGLIGKSKPVAIFPGTPAMTSMELVSRAPDEMRRLWLNAIEDVRIERQAAARYVGVARHLEHGRLRMIELRKACVDTDPIQYAVSCGFIFSAHGHDISWLHPGAKAILETLAPFRALTHELTSCYDSFNLALAVADFIESKIEEAKEKMEDSGDEGEEGAPSKGSGGSKDVEEPEEGDGGEEDQEGPGSCEDSGSDNPNSDEEGEEGPGDEGGEEDDAADSEDTEEEADGAEDGEGSEDGDGADGDGDADVPGEENGADGYGAPGKDGEEPSDTTGDTEDGDGADEDGDSDETDAADGADDASDGDDGDEDGADGASAGEDGDEDENAGDEAADSGDAGGDDEDGGDDSAPGEETGETDCAGAEAEESGAEDGEEGGEGGEAADSMGESEGSEDGEDSDGGEDGEAVDVDVAYLEFGEEKAPVEADYATALAVIITEVSREEGAVLNPYSVDPKAAAGDQMFSLAPKEDRANKLKKGVAHHVATLASQLRILLTSRSLATRLPDREIGRLDRRALYRLNRPGYLPSKNVFEQEIPGRKYKVAVKIMVDLSGSMQGEKTDLALQALCLLGDTLSTLEGLGVRWSATGFTANVINGYTPGSWSRQSSCLHYNYKGWAEPWKGVWTRIGANVQQLDNADADSIKWAARDLADQPADRHILLVLSDGAPCCAGNMMEQHTELQRVVKNLEAHDIEVWGIGILHPGVAEYYKNYRVVSKVDQLAKALIEVARAWFGMGAR
jgi:cobalamin biosynthesis protein CobT